MNPNPGLKMLLKKQDYSVEFYLDNKKKKHLINVEFNCDPYTVNTCGA